ncbi:MAG: NADH-quinone oxidoreductase subunit C [Acidimicrobiia bacterium]|nr:NADH-quinone oxidoreductase subunit C [Acidimicrobiia bacterium]
MPTGPDLADARSPHPPRQDHVGGDRLVSEAEANGGANGGDVDDAAEPSGTDAAEDSTEGGLLQELIEGFDGTTVEITPAGQSVVRIPKESLRDVAQRAHDLGFEVCADVTAVDWFREKPIRYEVVVSLLSISRNERVRIIAAVPRDDAVVPSLVPVYPGANFAEREAYDMFGIVFEDHPDLTRILMPDDWTGHPLRKDFDTGGVPVAFKGSPKVT